jgi:MFS family permease
MVNDLYFLHERGFMMGLYMNSISGGNTIGPLICGFVVESIGWRWHKWMAVIFTAINFLAVVLFVPETRYDRDISESLGAESTTAIDGLTSSSEEEIEAEKSATGAVKEVSGLPPQVPKKTYWQEISLWSGVPTDTNLLEMFIRPFPLIVYPAVLFAL